MPIIESKEYKEYKESVDDCEKKVAPFVEIKEYNISINDYKKKSQWAEVWRSLKKNKTAMVGLVIICSLLLVALSADLIADYEGEALAQNISEKLQTPSTDHWFGTDEYGRDIFARAVHGARISLLMGFAATFFSLLVGAMLGAVSGYFGGVTDSIIMRFLDMLMCIPYILLALVIIAALGPSIPNLLLAITISGAPGFARVIRSVILTVVNQEYIEAARICGASDIRIIMRHVLPNAMGPIIVQATMAVAGCITATAGLSFIGMGIQAPIPEWGAMLSSGREYMRYYPYLVIVPGMLIVITALSLNLLGDGLRDALDPRLKD